jgi:hypothetical protein
VVMSFTKLFDQALYFASYKQWLCYIIVSNRVMSVIEFRSNDNIAR